MFGFHLVTWFAIACWAAVFVYLWSKYPDSQMLHLRWIHLLGTLLVFFGFFGEPWIEFDFLGYIDPTPDLIRDLIPIDLISKLIRWFGIGWLSALIHWFQTFTSLNGITIHLLLTLGVATWIITWFPLIPLILSLPVVVLGYKSPGTPIARIGGRSLLFASIISTASLLLALPHLDAGGVEDSFQLTLLATILGIRLGPGVWACLLGLVLIGFGGLIEMTEKTVEDGLGEV